MNRHMGFITNCSAQIYIYLYTLELTLPFVLQSDDEKKNYFGAIPPNPISNRKTIRYLRKTTDASTALSIRQLPTFVSIHNKRNILSLIEKLNTQFYLP